MGDLGSIPGLERCPEEGKGYPLQYSGLENSMDCIVHGVTKSQTRLSDFHKKKKKMEEYRVSNRDVNGITDGELKCLKQVPFVTPHSKQG